VPNEEAPDPANRLGPIGGELSLRPIAIVPEELSPGLLAALVTLNNNHAIELSWADEARMRGLVGSAFHAERIGMVDALLIAFDQLADYDSRNFLWFRDHYASFVYVDRVVTAPRARGRGLARILYDRLIARTRAAGHERIVCEINASPPNPASEAFHRKLGFSPVGAAELEGGKAVIYFELQLT